MMAQPMMQEFQLQWKVRESHYENLIQLLLQYVKSPTKEHMGIPLIDISRDVKQLSVLRLIAEDDNLNLYFDPRYLYLYGYQGANGIIYETTTPHGEKKKIDKSVNIGFGERYSSIEERGGSYDILPGSLVNAVQSLSRGGNDTSSRRKYFYQLVTMLCEGVRFPHIRRRVLTSLLSKNQYKLKLPNDALKNYVQNWSKFSTEIFYTKDDDKKICVSQDTFNTIQNLCEAEDKENQKKIIGNKQAKRLKKIKTVRDMVTYRDLMNGNGVIGLLVVDKHEWKMISETKDVGTSYQKFPKINRLLPKMMGKESKSKPKSTQPTTTISGNQPGQRSNKSCSTLLTNATTALPQQKIQANAQEVQDSKKAHPEDYSPGPIQESYPLATTKILKQNLKYLAQKKSSSSSSKTVSHYLNNYISGDNLRFQIFKNHDLMQIPGIPDVKSVKLVEEWWEFVFFETLGDESENNLVVNDAEKSELTLKVKIPKTLETIYWEADFALLCGETVQKIKHHLVSMVCFVPYICLTSKSDHLLWVSYHDETTEEIGFWDDVVTLKSHFLSSILFFGADNQNINSTIEALKAAESPRQVNLIRSFLRNQDPLQQVFEMSEAESEEELTEEHKSGNRSSLSESDPAPKEDEKVGDRGEELVLLQDETSELLYRSLFYFIVSPNEKEGDHGLKKCWEGWLKAILENLKYRWTKRQQHIPSFTLMILYIMKRVLVIPTAPKLEINAGYRASLN